MRVSQTGNNPVQSSELSSAKNAGKAAATEAAAKKGKTAETSGSNDSAAVDGANATISSKAKEFAKAKEVATQAPDVREEKIAELKRRIAEGKYKVNSEAIADRMVDEHLKTAHMG